MTPKITSTACLKMCMVELIYSTNSVSGHSKSVCTIFTHNCTQCEPALEWAQGNFFKTCHKIRNHSSIIIILDAELE